MKPMKKPHSTRVLGAPDQWDEIKHGPCIGLPITDSNGVMYSFWKPTLIERLHVLVGRPIRLAIVGVSHPPVSLDTVP